MRTVYHCFEPEPAGDEDEVVEAASAATEVPELVAEDAAEVVVGADEASE